MSDEVFWSHGPASVRLLLDRQAQRDNLHKLCAGTIAASGPFTKKGITAATFFPELIPPKTPEEIKEEKRQQSLELIERTKRAANAKRRKLDRQRTK
jgi:hypothetical protein